MKEKKWNSSKNEIVKLGNGNTYSWQVVFNDGKYNENFDTVLKGYFLCVMAIDIIDPNDPKGYELQPLWGEVRLLRAIQKRSESAFNKSMEMANEILPTILENIEKDREDLKNKGVNEDDLNAIMRRYNDEMREKYDSANKGYREYEERSEEKRPLPVLKEKREKKVEKKKGITFDDVAGMEDVKEVLLDVIDQLKNPKRYEYFDIKPIKSLLMHGLPGTGKTFIANAFANEIDADFVKINMGDVASKYQGETGNNIKKIFDKARASEKFTVLMIDEVDSIASRRGTDDNSKEKNNTLNVLLTEMSDDNNENIFIITATNFYDLLDPAFKRVGRIDVTIEIPLPDFETRLDILKLNTKRKPLNKNVDLNEIAEMMDGKNCADVSFICDSSARIALKKEKDSIEHEDFIEALDKMNSKKETKKSRIGFSI